MDKVMVSTICLVYNHEKYLRDALDGFAMQKTDFPVEYIIHDDASTDHSADIIKEYGKKYPHLIKPIYQTENQYSQGQLTLEKQLSYCKGKYIAMCEGDDYWICDTKLQRQVDFLETHPEFSMCVNADIWYSEKTHKEIKRVSESEKDKTISIENYFTVDVRPTQTSSYVIRKEVLESIPQEIFDIAKVGDVIYIIWAVLHGNIRYFADKMSVHRRDVPGSWNERNQSTEKQIQHRHNLIAMWEYFKPLFPDESESYIDKNIERLWFDIDCIAGNWNNREKYKLRNQEWRKLLHLVKVSILAKN